LRDRAEDLLGEPMMFELCDLVREFITTVNDEVLGKIDALTDIEDKKTSGQFEAKITDANMTYTPVTKETFAAWCEIYMAKINKIKEARRTAADDKPTGRQMFEQNKAAFENLTLDEEGTAEGIEEETKEQEDEDEGEDFKYDATLYEAAEDEEIEFD
jgi:hypothetical protein